MGADFKLGFDPQTLELDIVLNVAGTDALGDDSLWNSVLASLLCDGQADQNDPVPLGADRRGWWPDEFFSTPIGSRRWLLERAKMLPANIALMAEYDKAALQWMVDADIAGSVDVSAVRTDTETITETVIITPPVGSNLPVSKYYLNWKATGELTLEQN